MPHYVEWDVATDRVQRVRRSQDAGTYAGDGLALADADLQALAATEPQRRYWVHDGRAIRPMTTTEKDAAMAADAAAAEAAAKQTEKAEVDRRHLRALVGALLPTVNRVRDLDGKAPVTLSQVRDAIKARIEAG